MHFPCYSFDYSPYGEYGSYYGDFYGEMIAGGALGALMGLFIGMFLLMLALWVMVCIFQAIAVHSIAKRRQIDCAWLAWVPAANLWVLGSISDQYCYVTQGKVTYHRYFLVVSVLLMSVSTLVSIMLLGGDVAVFVAVSLILALVNILLSFVYVIFFYIVLYNVFRSCNPDNAVLALVLSIVVSVTLPFFLFAFRKQDGGMPPRRQEPQPVITFYGDTGEEQ